MNRQPGEPAHKTFGALLQGFRLRAGLTQEALASAAGISPRAISDLERGVRRFPRRDTLALLAKALALSAEERADFESSALRPLKPRGAPVSDERDETAPYRGLRSFREEDARFFCGREAFTGALASLVSRQNFVAVVGPSGVGKSSVVHAGLVPVLRQSREPRWAIATLVPGQHPMHALAASLLSLLEPDITEGERLIEVTRVSGGLAVGKIELSDVVERVLERQACDRLLLFVDQWEELYTLTTDEEARQSFIDALLAASSGRSRLNVVLTLRGDFVGKVLGYRPLADRLQNAQLNLSTMTREETERAIVEPAKAVGIDFEVGLVSRILQDVATEPGALPLLEFVLAELWERREGGLLLHSAYEDMNGLRGAIAVRAEATLDRFSPVEQELVRQVLLHLVQPGEGTTDTRRRATLSELDAGSEEIVWELADARLLVLGHDDASRRETIEIAHEALIQHWSRLREWVDYDREFLLWRRRLASAVEQWEATGRDEGALLRGLALQEGQRWYSERADALWPEGRTFLERSIEVDHVATRRAGRRRLALLGGSAALSVIVSLLAIVAVLQWRAANSAKAESERALAIAESREMAGRANSVVESQPQLALLLAAEAYDRHPTVESKDAMARAIAVYKQGGDAVSRQLSGHAGSVHDVAFSPDGSKVASAGFDHTVRLWDPETGAAAGEPLYGHTAPLTSLAFSPDGRLLVSGSRDETIRLWEVATGRPLGQPITGHTGWVNDVGFSPDGELIASAGADGTVRLWSAETGASMGDALTGHTGNVFCLAFSPDGQTLASGGQDETIRFWRVPGGEALGEPLVAHSSYVKGLAFSADGVYVASASIDGIMKVWNAEDRELVAEAASNEAGWVNSVAFSSDDKWLAFSTSAGTVRLWEVDENRLLPRSLTGHSAQVTAVSFSPDGKTLASSSIDTTVRLWSLEGEAEADDSLTGHTAWVFGIEYNGDGSLLASASFDGTIRLWNPVSKQEEGPPLTGHADRVSSVVFSPSEDVLASGSADNTVRLWDLETHSQIGEPLAGHTELIYRIAFAPDGDFVASASADGTVRLWDVAQHRQSGDPLTGHEGEVYGVAFSPNGRTLASSGEDGTVRLWDVETRQPLGAPLRGHNGPVTSVVFSADGSKLITGSMDETVRIWDVESRTMLGDPLVGHSGWIYSVALSPDGETIASVSTDSTVRLWDLPTGQALGLPLTGHTGQVSGVDFSPDGTTLASSGLDKRVRLWLNPTFQTTCQIAASAPFPPMPSYLEGLIDHWACEESGAIAQQEAPR